MKKFSKFNYPILKVVVLSFIISFKYGASFAQKPFIKSFSPTYGSKGSLVVITGAGFSQTPVNNKVTINGLKASVIDVSSTTLSIIIPSGVSYGNISIEVNGNVASSNLAFNLSQDLCSITGFNRIGFNTASKPLSIIVGDFNGDLNPDLALANSDSSTVSILNGSGNGYFDSRVVFSVGSSPSSIAIGDFEGNGIQDIVSANFSSNSLSILIGKGDGRFSTQSTTYFVGVRPSGVTVGDFNNDGIQDLATSNSGSNTISVLLGTGLGLFGNQVTFSVGNSPKSIAVGDFNNDGNQDLLTANYGSNNVSVLIGDGTGSFNSQVLYAVGNQPCFLVVGDLNSDRILDFATANYGSNTVSILSGTGLGTFNSAINYQVGNSPNSIAIGDFDGDEILDLTISNYGSNYVSILFGTGSGLFKTQTTQYSGTISSLTVGDFNRDGNLDFASANYPENLTVFSCQCAPPTISSFSPTSGPIGTEVTILGSRFSNKTSHNKVLIGGINASITSSNQNFITAKIPEGVTVSKIAVKTNELTVTSKTTFDVTVNNCSLDTFQVQRSNSFIPNSFILPSAITNGDFNNDGILDIVIATSSNSVMGTGPNAITLITGSGNGSFGTAKSYNVVTYPNSIASGDLNGDGFLDLAVSTYYDGIKLLFGNGKGDFRTAYVVRSGELGPNCIAIGDFNADGIPDLVTTNYGINGTGLSSKSDGFYTYLGKGKGEFRQADEKYLGTEPYKVAIGDFNSDGIQDLLTANGGDNDISIITGTGNGSFGKVTRFGRNFIQNNNATEITVADFNRDEIQDFVISGLNDSVVVFIGTGLGTFQNPIQYSAGPGYGSKLNSVVVGDFNGDGISDIAAVISSNDFGFLSILIGTGTGTFNSPVIYTVDFNSASLVVGDYNGDGKHDLATINNEKYSPSVVCTYSGRCRPKIPMRIVTQPLSQSICKSQVFKPVTLSVTGFGPFTYLWSNGDTTNQLITNQEGIYTVTITGIGGKVVSNKINLSRISCGFQIVKQPKSQTECNLIYALFTVSTSGTNNLQYAWNDGTTANSLYTNIPGKYWATISSLDTTIVTDTVTLTSVYCPISIIQQPVSQSVCNGFYASLTVSVTGLSVPFIMWNDGTTGNSLFTNVPGKYWATISNPDTSIVSDTVSITTLKCLANIVIQPVSQTVCGDNFATFAVSITGESFYFFNWNNGESNSETTTNIPGKYWVNISNLDTTIVSDTVSLVNLDCSDPGTLIVISEPVPQTISGSNFATFSIAVIGNGPFKYEWNTGDTTSSISTNIPGEYWVTVTGVNSRFVSKRVGLTNNSYVITESQTFASENSISIYPNPFENELKVETKITFPYTIYSIEGHLVEKGLTNSTSIGSSIHSGIYQLKINEKVFKLIKLTP